MMLCPAYTGLFWSHREESNLQPTDYKTVALPVELRWHMCAVPLRLSHPGLGGDIMISHSQGSFQWDSAGAGHSCHRFRLHDRRASLPFSGAVRRSRLPGIVSFHSQLRGLWSGLINWLPQKVRVLKPSAGIEPASTIPDQGIALTIELQGHIAHGGGWRQITDATHST